VKTMTDADRAAATATRLLMKSPQEALKHAKLGLGAREEAAVLKKLISMPVSARGLFLKARASRSLRAAVKGHCLECTSYDRTEVAQCTALGCWMFPYRPFKDT